MACSPGPTGLRDRREDGYPKLNSWTKRWNRRGKSQLRLAKNYPDTTVVCAIELIGSRTLSLSEARAAQRGSRPAFLRMEAAGTIIAACQHL